jgi:gamma-glutamyltranspeptidase/glutathione hydrolase
MSKVIIASDSRMAAEAGAAIANSGGNAVDAAIAATIVSMSTAPGVIAPGCSGFITIWSPQNDPVVIDAYAEVPGRGLPPTRFGQGIREVNFDYGGGMKSVVGYGSVATPGIFAGLGTAWEQYGNISWHEIVTPAQQLAERGFPLSRVSADYLIYTGKSIFGWHRDSYRGIHHPDGSCLQVGDLVHIPGLANSLKLIATEGAEVFYRGELGEKIVREIQANQGLLTTTDLVAYRAIARNPISFRCGDWDIFTNPAPAIGGACLAAMLLLLEKNSFSEWDSAAVKTMAQIQQAVLDYRYQYLDGASNSVVTKEVERLLQLAGLGEPNNLLQSPSTIHTSAVDSTGMACAITASAGYGSGVMIADTGLWLNNSLGEIELHPHGLEGLAPGTRLASNMAPTIARRDDGTILAIGSPGASRITTALAQVLFNFLHLNLSLEDAIAHPRLHVEVFEARQTMAFETGLATDAIKSLVTRQFKGISMYFGGVQAALWNPKQGLDAVADPRRTGAIALGER